MRIYGDDSGDPGVKFRKGSTLHMCMGCILVDDYLAAEQRVRQFRADMGLPEHQEIKWSGSNDRVRARFLQCLDWPAHAWAYTDQIAYARYVSSEG